MKLIYSRPTLEVTEFVFEDTLAGAIRPSVNPTEEDISHIGGTEPIDIGDEWDI